MRVWQDRVSMLLKIEAENRGQRSQGGSWGEEIQSRGHKCQPWNPVMSPAPQAGRARSGSCCTKFPGLRCGLISRGTEISSQPAVGRNQAMSAASPRGHSLRACEQYVGAPLLEQYVGAPLLGVSVLLVLTSLLAPSVPAPQ